MILFPAILFTSRYTKVFSAEQQNIPEKKISDRVNFFSENGLQNKLPLGHFLHYATILQNKKLKKTGKKAAFPTSFELLRGTIQISITLMLTMMIISIIMIIFSKWQQIFQCRYLQMKFKHSLFAFSITAQKMKFSIKDFFSKCEQVRSKLRIWSHLLIKSLMETTFFS